MHDTLKNLFYNALIISDYGRKTITEIDIEKMSGLNKNDVVSILKENENIFNYASLMKNFCPICHKQLVDTQTGFCGGCGTTIDMSNISQYQIDINKTGFIDKSIEFLKKIFKEDGWIVVNTESNLLLMKKDEYYLALLFSLDSSSLKEYYYLKGWLLSTKNVCFVLLSKIDDLELTRFASKNPSIQLESSANIFLEDKSVLLFSKINYCLENIKQENKFEDATKGSFQEELDIRELQSQLDNILKDLDNLALHNNNLSNSKNGYMYQSSIIRLLNLTLLPIKVLAKQDIQDALVRVPQNYGVIGKQVRWVPLEIKSFRPKQKIGPYFSMKEYSAQFRKYIAGYLNTDVLSIALIECFVVLAYDFLLDKENIEVIEEIEKDYEYRIHISLLPQSSLLYLIKKKMGQKNPIRNFDHIVNLFRNNRYIEKKKIDEFYNNIDSDYLKSGEETTLKNVQKIVHKKGK